MPLYEYKCNACGDVFEVMQKFSDPTLEVHEGCGGAVERLISPPAFQFKGSGWYVTDYARSGGSGNGKEAAKETKKETPPAADTTKTEKPSAAKS